MDSVDFLVVGAGVSGLSFANEIRAQRARSGDPELSVLVLEADNQPGGYCKTVVQDGFVWDYSGHFFHFRHPEIEAWLRQRMGGQVVRTVEKRSFVRYAGRDIDFPFQKNIHQLPREDFIDCLYHLYFREEGEPTSFKQMVQQKLGQGIADRFLIPYNEKLYACDLDDLDADAMGRFFPVADIDDVIRNMKTPDNSSYNSTFTYPEGGAIQYIHALLRDLPPDAVSLGEPLLGVDLDRRVATTPSRAIRYGALISSAPFPALLDLCAAPRPRAPFAATRCSFSTWGSTARAKATSTGSTFPIGPGATTASATTTTSSAAIE
jgi:protoporphyrinogen oxidase